MPLFILTSLAGITLLLSVVRTLRLPDLGRRSAALWIGVSLLLLPVMFVPTMLDPVAVFLRVRSGADLALASGLVLLLLLTVDAARAQHGLRRRAGLLASELSALRAQLDLPALPGTPALPTPLSPAPPVPRPDAEGPVGDLLEDGALR